METEKAHATDAITEGIGDASESWQFLTILKWQCVVIWKPSQIFERSEEGASSRKGACPFAFALQSSAAGWVATTPYNPADFVLTE
jgi:hypothetical protein